MDGIQPTYNLAEQGGGLGSFGNEGLWLFAILALFGFGGNGFFGNKGNGDYARQSDVVYTSAFNQLQDENANIINEIQRGTLATSQNIKDAAYNNLGEIRDIGAQVSTGFSRTERCCCDIQRAIDGVNYNGALNTASINANTTAQTQKILDTLQANKIAEMQNQINELNLKAAMNGVVRYPLGMTYNAGSSPFCGGCGGFSAM